MEKENILMDTLKEVSKSRELNDLQLKATDLYYKVIEAESIPDAEKNDILDNLATIISTLKDLS